jgi:hypothetical protein
MRDVIIAPVLLFYEIVLSGIQSLKGKTVWGMVFLGCS